MRIIQKGQYFRHLGGGIVFHVTKVDANWIVELTYKSEAKRYVAKFAKKSQCADFIKKWDNGHTLAYLRKNGNGCLVNGVPTFY